MKSALQLVKSADHFLGQGRILSAKLLYEEAARREPKLKPAVYFNLAFIYESAIGCGTKARQLYLLTQEHMLECGDTVPDSLAGQLEANTCENLMFFCLSHEEYEQRADDLARLQPSNPIHVVQRQQVREMVQEGRSWRDVLEWMGAGFFNLLDPSQDPGLHGKGAAMFELMLANRDLLRIPKEKVRTLSGLYTALIWKVCFKHASAMERAVGVPNAGEIRFVVEKAIPIVEECLRYFPNEDMLAKGLHVLQEILRQPVSPVKPLQEMNYEAGVSKMFTDPVARPGLIGFFVSRFNRFRAKNLANRAFRFVEVGRYDDAVDLLTYAVKVDPGYGHAHNELAFVYGKAGHLEVAEKHAWQAVKCDPGHPKFWNAVTGIQLDRMKKHNTRQELLGDVQRRMEEINAAIAGHPECAAFHLQKASTMAQGGAPVAQWEREVLHAARLYRQTGCAGTDLAQKEAAIEQIIEQGRSNCVAMARYYEHLPEAEDRIY